MTSSSCVPVGLRYITSLFTVDEERGVAAELVALPDGRWTRQTVMGNPSRRRMACFGWQYNTASRGLPEMAPSLTSALLVLRAKAAGAAGLEPEPFVQAIANYYEIGAGFTGAHIDSPVFGPDILGVSFLGAARMLFRHKPLGLVLPAGRKPPIGYELVLEPRSLLVLSGLARSEWMHEIVPVTAERISITFRSVVLAAPKHNNLQRRRCARAQRRES